MFLPPGQKTGSWSYCTPIYMLNYIIRLQAIVEIITNKTRRALNLLVIQSTKMHVLFVRTAWL
jgi:hypothetical protein